MKPGEIDENKKSNSIWSRIKKFFMSNKLTNYIKEKGFLKKRYVKYGIIPVVVLIILCIIIIPRITKSRAALSTSTLRTSVVRRGNISTTISGSGAIISSSRIKVTSKVGSTVTAIHFKEGDKVKAGDLIMELDDTSAQAGVEASKSNLVEMQMTQESNVEDLNSLRIVAPYNGVVSKIAAETGSIMNNNAVVLNIVDTSRMKVLLTFGSEGMREIAVGKEATVYLQDFMEALTGKVTYVSSSSYTTESGGDLYKVEIEIANPGSIQEGMIASGEISISQGTVSSMDSAGLTYVNKSSIRTSAGGTVTAVNVKENQYVKKGETMVTLENKNTVRTKTNTDSKLKDFETQLENSENQLGYCKVYAPIDGVIVSQTINVGDSAKVGDVLTTVADSMNMQFTIPVDELDIDKLQIGQKANVNFDALSETTLKPLTGEVAHIALEGTSTNGVTTYPVIVSVSGSDKLRGGMNANAEIFITNKENVLTVPIEAVQRIGGKSYVMLKGDPKTIEEMKKKGTYIDLFNTGKSTNTPSGASTQNSGQTGNSAAQRSQNQGNNQSNRTGSTNNTGSNQTQRSNQSSAAPTASSALSKYKDYYVDAIPALVEVGVNNETNIEIISGVKEGDVVMLPPLATTQSQSQTNAQTTGRMIQGGGTGIPFVSGGAPRN